ncbi:hypothetical protein O3G_MSEX011035 [Manduca sexta]|uniref:Cytochrome P450 n=1 Tax=Manduca sexta TaxID=7130 RepID=A0A921ZKF7_MANSE|nr:hypothetical protein O3G_MSEX011035 [Manduca sexta]KAG6458739.1 hypothetical protein O3G_MSEX011035 [Manduca sexta]
MFVCVLLVVVILLLLSSVRRRRDMLKLYEQIGSGIKTLPIIGHSYLFLGGDENRMRAFQILGRDAFNRDGMTSVWHANRFFIVVADPIIADVILKSCLEKDDIMKLAQLLTDNGSIFAAVSIWRPRRKILASHFNTKILNDFVSVFSKQSEILITKLKETLDRGSFSVWNYFTTYTMDAVCETSLGVQVKSQHNPDQPFLKAFEECCDLGSARMVQPWLHSMTVYRHLPQYKRYMKNKYFICDFIKKIVQSKRKDNELRQISDMNGEQYTGSEGVQSLLELLIKNSNFTDIELQEESVIMVLAGTDTTAVAGSFTALMLSQHLDVQDKVYEELREVFGDSNRAVEPDDLAQLKYLDAVVRETLRLYPPVPVITRKVERDVALPGGVTLIPGCGVVVNIWAIHRNPHYWGDDAEEFRPERFLDSALKHPAAFMPFSYGPRGCLGYRYAMMALKSALASLLRQYRLMPDNESYATDKREPLRLKFDIMMKDVNNFRLRIESRN